MAGKPQPEGARFYEAGPSETCTDCGMRIDPETARFERADGRYAHAYSEHCILYLSGEDVRQVVSWDDFAALRASNERLREAVALLNSMVLSGESHSEHSRQVVRGAVAAPW